MGGTLITDNWSLQNVADLLVESDQHDGIAEAIKIDKAGHDAPAAGLLGPQPDRPPDREAARGARRRRRRLRHAALDHRAGAHRRAARRARLRRARRRLRVLRVHARCSRTSASRSSASSSAPTPTTCSSTATDVMVAYLLEVPALDAGHRVRETSPSSRERGSSMSIPTELVGSLPRPMKLQEAYADYDEGKISWEDLKAEQDAAAEDSIRRLEEVGEPIVTDGEQRESSFATYPITDTLAGTGLADNLAGDGQYFAIFDDGHHRQLPRLTGGPFALQDVRLGVRREEPRDRHAPGQAGGHRAVDADAAAPARGRDPRLLARAVPERPVRRVREGHPPVLRRRRGARLDRLHRGPAREQERLAQPVDRRGHAAGLHRPQQPRDRPLQRRGAHEHRRPHLPGRRLRLRALQGRARTRSC